jgi:signal transduction histidine kinase
MERHNGTSSSRRELLWGLALISLAVAAHLVVIAVWTESSSRRAQKLYRDALTSIELITRIARDLDQQRILLDMHILQAEAPGMQQVERDIDRAAVDLQRAVNAYSPHVELPGEEVTWFKARQLIAPFETTKTEVLALSRQNRDAEARARLTAEFGEFTELQRRIVQLIAIDRAGADAAMMRTAALRRVNVVALLVTGIVVLLVVLVLGQRAIRRITSYEEQITGYARMLEERNRELDAFAGRLAHDLLGPVASLTLSADLLSRPDGAHQSALDRLRRSIAHISTMTRDLLEFARADTSAASASCDPAVVAAQVGDDFLLRRGSEASLHLDVEAAAVTCREGLLRQVLWNLVENGVKYRRDEVDAKIVVSGLAGASWYELRVSDNGRGMQPEDAAHVFEPFYRADATRHVPGTGLGLSIVKRIVEAGGGGIRVETAPGRGSTFVLRLPLARKSPGFMEAA